MVTDFTVSQSNAKRYMSFNVVDLYGLFHVLRYTRTDKRATVISSLQVSCKLARFGHFTRHDTLSPTIL